MYPPTALLLPVSITTFAAPGSVVSVTETPNGWTVALD